MTSQQWLEHFAQQDAQAMARAIAAVFRAFPVARIVDAS